MRRKLAAGNWKMNGTSAALAELETLAKSHAQAKVEILICPPATLLAHAAATTVDSAVAIGGQDCHAAINGAHTGDISAEMLKDAGATAVILGHSERRCDHAETSAQVAAKTSAAWAAGLTAIVCLGETLEQREAGETLAVVGNQLAKSLPDGVTAANTVIAYEPVWAIGTGKVPTLEQIAKVHGFLRAALASRFGTQLADAAALLYGGSVKASNAAEIFAISNVDGALVGGASLKAADFSPIITALEAS
ncbi:Triosephosphate isomerase [Phaeobacter sp. CECT 5382]|uniref:triose-phosphate isomerase n=1 Tax=Phaeobacter sp. CECT 5382 TaxID=1712645 RepID=UPI0006DB1D66|nr:triose-phosphate isomerase [Phaeobacter sp. CECT 5382]CUH86283.1 Triosephosphate isomerase [Phaeobacter sp. CECT 5382]